MLKYGRIEVDETHKPIKYQINDNDCYEVISHANRGNGYCCIKMNGKIYDIHRWYYQKMNPNIDLTDLVVRHKCDNRKCINLEHLEHGKQQDNVIDMVVRGRSTSKFTIQEIKNIAIVLEEDYLSYLQIANLFDTTKQYIKKIASGNIFGYITKLSDKNLIYYTNEKYIYWHTGLHRWRFSCYNKLVRISRTFHQLNEAIQFKNNYFNNTYLHSTEDD